MTVSTRSGRLRLRPLSLSVGRIRLALRAGCWALSVACFQLSVFALSVFELITITDHHSLIFPPLTGGASSLRPLLPHVRPPGWNASRFETLLADLSQTPQDLHHAPPSQNSSSFSRL